MARKFLAGVLLWCLLPLAGAADRYLEEAQAYLDKGETKAAVIQLKNLLREEPLNGEARVLLGRAYLRLGDGAGAVKELEKARDLNVAPRRWLIPLAQAYLLQREAKKLLSRIEVPENQPDDFKARILALRGMAQLWLNRREEARAAFAESVKLDPSSEEGQLGLARLSLVEGQPEQVLVYVGKVLERNPESVDAYLLRAEVQRQEGKVDAAIASFTEVLNLRPGEARALLGRAAMFIARDKPEDAHKDLNAARKILGEVPMVLYLQGLLDFRRGELQAAEDALVKVVNAAPAHLPSKLLLGIIAYRQNELVAAEEYLDAVHNRLPDHLQAIKLLAAVKLKRKLPQDAIALLEPYRDRFAEDPQFLALLGSAYLQNRQFDEGTELLTEAARLAPDVAAIRTQLALGQMASGEMESAVGQLEQAVTLEPGMVQADVMLVLALMQQKKYDQALAAARQLAAKMPDNPMPVNLVAAAELGRGNVAEAERRWREVLQKHPDYLTAALNLARLQFRQGKLQEAEAHYRRILDRRPGHSAALIGLAQVAEGRKEYGKMAAYLEEAQTRNPKDLRPAVLLARYYLARGETLKALGISRTAVEYHPEDPHALRLLGQAQMAADQAASAVATFRKLVDRVPHNPLAQHLLALALERNGDDEAALATWEKVLALKLDFLPAAVNRIRLLLKQQRYDESLAAARDLQTRFPDKAAGYFWEGEVALARKQPGKALDAFRKSHELAPSATTARYLYQLYRQTGKGEKGEVILKNWLQKSPRDAAGWILLALGYQQAGKPESAIGAYEKALEIQPENLLVLNNLAWLYQETDDPRVLQMAERLAGLAKERPEMLDTVGWIYTHHGRLREGLTLLQEAAVRAPHLPEIRVHLAKALVRSGRKEEAAKELQRLLREKPHFAGRRDAESLLNSLGID